MISYKMGTEYFLEFRSEVALWEFSQVMLFTCPPLKEDDFHWNLIFGIFQTLNLLNLISA